MIPTKEETKMWSYRMTWDTMFAPNPFFDMLTLATCKPIIRKSPNTKVGMWIAGWTACTIHNSELAEKKVEHIKKNEEKLIYLAQIDEILSLNEYWEKYPQKRCVVGVSPEDTRWYGDNIYHKDKNGVVIQEKNNNDHGKDDINRDYNNGKRVLICKRFYYFTPEKRLGDIPLEFYELIHGGIGQSIKGGEKVDRFIDFVAKCAKEEGIDNGIVGNLPIVYPTGDINVTNNNVSTSQPNEGGKKKRGCGK